LAENVNSPPVLLSGGELSKLDDGVLPSPLKPILVWIGYLLTMEWTALSGMAENMKKISIQTTNIFSLILKQTISF